jgi:hypothetical protein
MNHLANLDSRFSIEVETGRRFRRSRESKSFLGRQTQSLTYFRGPGLSRKRMR